MDYDFNFDRDSKFLTQSSVMQYVQEELKGFKYLDKVSPKILNVTLKLWGESIIKHNLDLNMTGIDHIHLISEQNSKEVKNVIGKIMWKHKGSRNDKDFEILREVGQVFNCLQMIVLENKKDVCADLKSEFVDFKKLSLDTSMDSTSNPTSISKKIKV